MIDDGWSGLGWHGWTNLDEVRGRLAAGADPNVAVPYVGPPLQSAAERGSAQVVAELARRVEDVDALWSGRTALWCAVAANRADTARALVAEGADPERDMMSGWSPARLSLAGPTPDLFESSASLTPEETETVRESGRLIGTLGGLDYDGLGIACVMDIDVAEAVRRLDAEIVEDPNGGDDISVMGITAVPGGCVVAQPWGYGPSMPGVTRALSVDTTCYGMYANPKSGNQGSITRGGETIGWDLHPGGGVDEEQDNVLLSYLYQGEALAFCFAFAGLRPVDDRAVCGPPDVWIRLPERDYWH
ncbi:ankyrin repeat domain-containing protein [Actinophytocola sediminis]